MLFRISSHFEKFPELKEGEPLEVDNIFYMVTSSGDIYHYNTGRLVENFRDFQTASGETGLVFTDEDAATLKIREVCIAHSKVINSGDLSHALKFKDKLP